MKTKMMRVLDTKPKMNQVLDIKPKNISINEETEIYLEGSTIRTGEPMGLLLSLTYPSTFTFIRTRY